MARNKEPIDKLRNAVIILSVGFFLYIIVGTFVGLAVHQSDVDRHKHDQEVAAQQAEVFLQTQIRGCQQYDTFVTLHNNFVQNDENTLTLFAKGVTDPDRLAQLNAVLGTYEAVKGVLRDCSRDCVVAYIDTNAPDCPPPKDG